MRGGGKPKTLGGEKELKSSMGAKRDGGKQMSEVKGEDTYKGKEGGKKKGFC